MQINIKNNFLISFRKHMGSVAHYLAYKFITDSWFQVNDTYVNKVGKRINLMYSTSLLLYAPYGQEEILNMSAMHLDYNMIKMIENFDQGNLHSLFNYDMNY